MPPLHIDPSELYPAEIRIMPRPGASVAEWSAFRGQIVRETVREPVTYLPRPKRKTPTKVTPFLVERVVEMAVDHSDPAIASKLGCSPHTVYRIRKSLGIIAFARPPEKGGIVFPTPDWVPAEYALEFREKLRKRGSTIAIKWVRCRMAGKEKPGPMPGSKLRFMTILAKKIADRCEREFNIEAGSIFGPSRERHVTYARHIAVRLIRKLTGRPFSWIGHHMSRRDHSTMLNSVQCADRCIAADADLAARVEAMERELAGEVEG